MDEQLRFRGRGWIPAALFDLGLYPAAIPAADGQGVGRSLRGRPTPQAVLAALDEIEGYQPYAPDASLYVRRHVPVLLEDAAPGEAWAYFYNAPLGRAPRIASGDYLVHLKVK